MAATKTLDKLVLRNLYVTCCIGPDAWSRPGKQQPVILTLNLQLDTSTAGTSDDISNTFSYGTICKDILSGIEGGHFDSITRLISHIAQIAEDWPGERLRVVALAPKSLLRVEGGLGKEVLLEKKGISKQWHVSGWEWAIRGLKVACIIGVNPHERLEKQVVVIELRIGSDGKDEESPEEMADNAIWRYLVRATCENVESSTFQTLEALAALIAYTCLRDSRIPRINVLVEKPSALTAVEGAGVEITRNRQWMLRRQGRA